MAEAKKLILSKESAQFILEGLNFFKKNPQAKEWHKLDKDTFLVLARDVAQFYPDKEESLEEYLLRFESFLRRIINSQELAPSIPENLNQLVEAFEAFQKEQDADINLKKTAIVTSQDVSLEDWIKNLQEKHLAQRIAKEVEEAVAPIGLPEEQKETVKETLTQEITASVPMVVITRPEQEKSIKEKISRAFEKEKTTVVSSTKQALVNQQLQELADRARFLTVPIAVKTQPSPTQKTLEETIAKVLRQQTPIKEEAAVQKVAQAITQVISQKVPKLDKSEQAGLSALEKFALVENTINASLPEIVQALTNPEITSLPIEKTTINPQDGQEFLQLLTGQINQPVLDLSSSLKEDLNRTRQQKVSFLRPETKIIFDQLEENPLLPYQLIPQEELQPLGNQIRAVVNYRGISPGSAEIIQYQNEEAAGLRSAIEGKTSFWWQNQTNRFQAQGAEEAIITQTTKRFNLQLHFEEKFPQFKNFYQQAFSWSGPRKWFNQVTSPIAGLVKEKVGSWWQKTGLAKKLAQRAESKASLFFKKTLGSFSIFKAGVKKTLQEGAKKGVTKAISWLATKLAATKLGAILGSIAPGIGNAIGAAVGFVIDVGLGLIRGGFRLFSNVLQKVSGGETEAEKTIKANFGPLGKIALSPITLIVIGVPILIILLALGLFQIEEGAFVVDVAEHAVVFYGSCYVEDIHQTDVITDENLAIFIARNKAAYPNSLIEEKIHQVIAESISVGFNPALAIAIWGEESHFSDYSNPRVVPGRDFGCGVYCSSNQPSNFDESLACFVAKRTSCNSACLSRATFAEFMECYGPVAENPNFISNTLKFYQQLVPSGPGVVVCPGGTTGEFASQLLNHLIACYGNIINRASYNDQGVCLLGRGVSQSSVQHITWSVGQFSALQCVGFAKAVEVETGAGSLGFVRGAYGDAANYYRPLTGYQQVPKSQQNVMVGDLAFFSGTIGHVGVVVDVAPDMSWFIIAQAIGYRSGSAYGLINESGRIHITYNSLLGFLRRAP
ncbi:MAG: CHAP domain-containing protein [Candidatus Shapirobacteria bacterium]|nr:CHAP domain-containing protein [Candidatus Shapirobacteria bacterium]